MERCTYYLNSTRDFHMSLGDQLLTGMHPEKVSKFLDYQLKPVMQKGKWYIRDSGRFLEKIKNISTLSENAILVTADVVGLYPSIPHQAA